MSSKFSRSFTRIIWRLQREADLHKLAKALLENETLDAKEIKEILSPLQLVEDLDTSRQLDTVPSVRPL